MSTLNTPQTTDTVRHNCSVTKVHASLLDTTKMTSDDILKACSVLYKWGRNVLENVRGKNLVVIMCVINKFQDRIY